MKVLNFGSLNLDYVYQVESILIPGETQASRDRQTFCGGKGLNQSIALAKAEIPVYHAGMIGDGGEILLEICKENGVNTEFIRKITGPCGHTVIQVDKDGQNCILLYGGANRSITREFVDEVLSAFGKDDIILLQNEINELDYIVDRAYEKGMMIILNPSPYDDKLKACDMSKVSMFLVNEIEGYQITGERKPERILAAVKEKYPSAKIVLTLGGDGSVYQDETGIYHQGIFKVKAVDTTAAGDTFTGYFISSIIDGMSVKEGLEMAAKASAIAVSRPGATASIPIKQEVLDSRL
ncbi:ribokinase [Blautia obeum]|uniref:Ribokinase n=1 Tax=Blautia obeum TaxID=40520 RepID=A0A564SDJ2_9FIRM|nr:ribokinase [Blautia obeum]VUW93217.1 Ribokinase [Blautia obeum]